MIIVIIGVLLYCTVCVENRSLLPVVKSSKSLICIKSLFNQVKKRDFREKNL